MCKRNGQNGNQQINRQRNPIEIQVGNQQQENQQQNFINPMQQGFMQQNQNQQGIVANPAQMVQQNMPQNIGENIRVPKVEIWNCFDTSSLDKNLLMKSAFLPGELYKETDERLQAAAGYRLGKEEEMKKKIKGKVEEETPPMYREDRKALWNHNRGSRDSEEMMAVKNGMKRIEGLLFCEPENMGEVLEQLDKEYGRTIEFCKTYLRTRNPKTQKGQERKRLVRENMEKLIMEYAHFKAVKGAYGTAPNREKREIKRPADIMDQHKLRVSSEAVGKAFISGEQEVLNSLKHYKDRADGKEMRELKDAYGKLASAFLAPIQNGDKQRDEVLKAYDDTIEKCKAYIASAESRNMEKDFGGKTRLDYVRELSNKLENRRFQFSLNYDKLASNVPYQGVTMAFIFQVLMDENPGSTVRMMKMVNEQARVKEEPKQGGQAKVEVEEKQEEHIKVEEEEKQEPQEIIEEAQEQEKEEVKEEVKQEEKEEVKEEVKQDVQEEVKEEQKEVRTKEEIRSSIEKEHAESEKRIDEIIAKTKKEIEENAGKNSIANKNKMEDPKYQINASDSLFSEKFPRTLFRQEPLITRSDQRNPGWNTVTRSEECRDSYLTAALAGLAMQNPAYLKNHVIAEDNKGYAVVRLYDEKGDLQLIRVDKTKGLTDEKWSGDRRHLWLVILEKACAVLLKNTGSGAGYRYEGNENKNWETHKEEGKLSRKQIELGNAELASRLLFGRTGLKLTLGNQGGGDNGDQPDTTGDETIGKMLAYIEEGKIVTASLRKDALKPGSPYYELLKESNESIDEMDLEPQHEFMVIGEGEDLVDGQRTLHLHSTAYSGKDIEIPFGLFKNCFESAYIMGPEETNRRNIRSQQMLNTIKDEHEVTESRVDEAFKAAEKEIAEKGSDVMEKRKKEVKEPTYTIDVDDFEFAFFNSRFSPPEGKLFSEEEMNPMSVVKDEEYNDSYLMAALSGLAMKDPDYIKNTLITDLDEEHAIVTLYDEKGDMQKIKVDKTSGSTKRPVWVALVKKAALVLLNREKGEKKAKFRYKESDNKDWAKHQIKRKFIKDQLENGDEELASRLLFGRAGMKLSTRNQEQDNYNKDHSSIDFLHEKGDETIGKMLAYAKNGKIVTATTCKNNARAFEASPYYNSETDSVAFPIELQESHEFTVIGEGDLQDGQRTVRLKDAAENKTMDITFGLFKTCFTEVYIMGPEK